MAADIKHKIKDLARPIIVGLTFILVLLMVWFYWGEEPTYKLLFVWNPKSGESSIEHVDIAELKEDLKEAKSEDLLAKLQSLALDEDEVPLSTLKAIRDDESERKALAGLFRDAFDLPQTKTEQTNSGGTDEKVFVTYTFEYDCIITFPTGVQASKQQGLHPLENAHLEKEDERNLTHAIIRIGEIATPSEFETASDKEYNEWVTPIKTRAKSDIADNLASLSKGDLYGTHKSHGERVLADLLRTDANYLEHLYGDKSKDKWNGAFGKDPTSDAYKNNEYYEHYARWMRLLVEKRRIQLGLVKPDSFKSQLDDLESLAASWVERVRNPAKGGTQVDGSMLSIAQYALLVVYLERELEGGGLNLTGFESKRDKPGQFSRIAKNLTACIEHREGISGMPIRSFDGTEVVSEEALMYSTSPMEAHLHYLGRPRPSLVGGKLLYYALRACMELDSNAYKPAEKRERVIFWLAQALALKNAIEQGGEPHNSYTACYLKRASAILMLCCAQVRAVQWGKAWEQYGGSTQWTDVKTKWSKFYKPLSELGYLQSLMVMREQPPPKVLE